MQASIKKTINKVLVELQKDTPDLSYIRGLLEVLVDNDEPHVCRWEDTEESDVKPYVPTLPAWPQQPPPPQDPEAAILDGMAAAKLAEVKRMSGNA